MVGFTSRMLRNRSGVGSPAEEMVVTIGEAVEMPAMRAVVWVGSVSWVLLVQFQMTVTGR